MTTKAIFNSETLPETLGKELFNFKNNAFTPNARHQLIYETLRTVLFLPPSLMKAENSGIKVQPFELLSGADASTALYLAKTKSVLVHGDLPIALLLACRAVLVSRRTWNGESFIVYKVWSIKTPPTVGTVNNYSNARNFHE
jgi:hypothetical protein